MTNKLELTCYHITNMDSAQKIIALNKFHPKDSPKHYLGQGNYFYKDKEMALENIKHNTIINGNSTNETRICLSAVISVDKSNYLDLDCYDNIEKFRQYASKISQSIIENKIKLTFKQNSDYGKNKNSYIMCFLLDIYKKEFDFFVIKRTYQNSRSGLFFQDMKFNPIPHHETYICVSNDKCIRDIKLNNNTYNNIYEINEGGSYV